MSKSASTGNAKPRPSTLQTVKSFTRYEPAHNSAMPGRHRASTVQSTIATPTITTASPVRSPMKASPADSDVFEKPAEENTETISPLVSKSQSLPERFDELPIELASLTDRFVESLGAKVYNEPPTIERLSELFQEFYVKAASHIATHISTLLLRLNRQDSASSLKSSIGSKSVTSKPSIDSISSNGGTQQMLTASEVTERRRARRLIEYKRVVLEEAVERRACEKVYDKIWRHKSTLDDVRDEKLRSKTAALALVGIGLKDLGIELGPDSVQTEEDIQESLSPAREELAMMNEEKSPFGKLQHLTSAHKFIVDTLSAIHSSSSSADEILPTLIYTLITSPIEGINIISNLNFIQRFRAASKIDGEAAYCMTNLEAAISFLENVDLASLRADEAPEGPPKSSSRPSTPLLERAEPYIAMPPPLSTTSTTKSSAAGMQQQPSLTASKTLSVSGTSSPRHQRTLSDLLQPGKQVLTTANDAVRGKAKEGFDGISSTLDSSFKFMFGRLRERSEGDSNAEVVVPKTLDEARQLVTRPMTPEEDETAISEASSILEKDDVTPPHAKPDDKLLSIIGGRKPSSLRERERSVDSLRSNGSANSKKVVAFASTEPTVSTAKPLPSPSPIGNPLDSVKSIGNSLSHLANPFAAGFRGFGKAVTPSPPSAAPAVEKPEARIQVSRPTAEEQAAIKVPPPIARFMEMADAGELRVKDVERLLEDYQRLGRVIMDLAVGR